MADKIVHISIDRASDEAVKLWALASTQYPKDHGLILDAATSTIIEVVSAFALNARRSLEILPPKVRFALRQPRWNWTPSPGEERVSDLRDALNRIIHAQELRVAFVPLPPGLSVLEGGALVAPYIQAATDIKTLASIDTFALAHAFLYEAFPKLLSAFRSLGTKTRPTPKR
jgi:hypothetical protein